MMSKIVRRVKIGVLVRGGNTNIFPYLINREAHGLFIKNTFSMRRKFK